MRKFFLIGFAIFLIQSVFAQNEVAFSLRGGFYEESFTLELSCAEHFHIRYTVNGATPSAHSALYVEPLLLDERLYSQSNIYTVQTANDELFYAPESVQHCITLRAAAFDDEGRRVGSVVTQSYFIRS